MDPNQQNQGTPGGNPYEFILNPEKPKSKLPFKGGGSNKLLTYTIFGVVGVIILMIVVTLLLNAFAPKKIDREQRMALAQTQTELIRVADQGSKDARQQVTKNLATTIQYTMTTQQKRIVEPLGKVGKKELALKQKASTDQQLTSSKQTSTFDTTFTKIIGEELNTYALELKGLFDLASTDKERDLMSDLYKQTQLLIAQIPYTQDGIEAGQ